MVAFVDAEKGARLESSEAAAFFRRLYAIEARGKSLSPDARQQVQMTKAEPIWKHFRRWLDGIPPDKRLPKSLLGKAITYMNNYWGALTLYLTNGRIPIDNSQSERMIRPLTIGRKNWLFLGHPQAAESRMRLFSITSTADRHHLMLDQYLEYVLRELSWADQNAKHELALGSDRMIRCLPDRWAESNADNVRQFRREKTKTGARKLATPKPAATSNTDGEKKKKVPDPKHNPIGRLHMGRQFSS
ncbi:IS66 family transposase [Planctomycetaceae bacterium SH139]